MISITQHLRLSINDQVQNPLVCRCGVRHCVCVPTAAFAPNRLDTYGIGLQTMMYTVRHAGEYLDMPPSINDQVRNPLVGRWLVSATVCVYPTAAFAPNRLDTYGIGLQTKMCTVGHAGEYLDMPVH